MRRYWYLPFFMFACIVSNKLFAQQADTFLLVRLKEVEVKDTRKWMNDTARYRFNQMRYYVTTILPYVTTATQTFNEVNAQINEQKLSKKARKKLIRAKEERVRNEFEDQINALNETQGVLLIKLIARQTGLNIYSMLSEVKNPFVAVKWQAWARLHGFNLNKRYNPEDEQLLEQVMLSLGYDLPSFYHTAAEANTALKTQ